MPSAEFLTSEWSCRLARTPLHRARPVLFRLFFARGKLEHSVAHLQVGSSALLSHFPNRRPAVHHYTTSQLFHVPHPPQRSLVEERFDVGVGAVNAVVLSTFLTFLPGQFCFCPAATETPHI